MIITVLGSCRQESIKKYFNVTSIQEQLTYPHYTKEIIQAIKYCKDTSSIDNELTKYCFRTGILNKKSISCQNELQAEFEKTDIFVIEIASRISYEWNNLYVHHILSENQYGFHDIPNIIIRELSDKEIEDDILKIRNLLYPKKLLIVPHIYTRTSGKRYELVRLLEQLTSRHNIPFINPSELLKNYTDIFQPDHILHHYTDKGHSLVGEEYKKLLDTIKDEKICIHNYLSECKTNPQPPGLADFLRGTIALYNFSKIYGYKLYINGNHPIFSYMQPNISIITYNNIIDVEEILPPLSYEDIYARLQTLFQNKQLLNVTTNCFYSYYDESLYNFGSISEDCRDYMKNILSPSQEIISKLDYVFNTIYNIKLDDEFKVIHLRCGDNFIHHNIFDENLYIQYYNKIINLIILHANTNFVLISDSSRIGAKLKQDIPQLKYWDNNKIHLGDLKNNTDTSVLDTLLDFYTMSKSNEIISGVSSGFSIVNSLIYNIKYTSL